MIASVRSRPRGRVALCISFAWLLACDSPTTSDRNPDPPGSGDAPAHPFPGAALYLEPSHPADPIIDEWRQSRPDDAELLERIAHSPQAVWLSGASTDDERVASVTSAAAAAGAVPVFAAYNVPHRNCGSNGAEDGARYRAWITGIANALAGRDALFVLEPDGVAGVACLSDFAASERLDLIAFATRTLEDAGAAVYIDAGHPRWHAVETIAQLLLRAGIADAHGFALNVANFVGTAENRTYGNALSARLNGFGYVIDTGRNGEGPPASGEWCNPPGRALGQAPTFSTGESGVHAYLWVKRPGESDGTCNGGPASGTWWTEYALGLASRAD